MNKMYEYLKEHAYVSENKHSNYQFELSKERAECIANKYNSLTEELQQENKQLKEQLSVSQTNEETFRLEMVDITKILGLDEDTLFDDVKAYASSLKNNWNKLREYFNERIEVCDDRLSSPFCNFEKATKERLIFSQCLEKLEELEQGSDSNVKD